MTNNGLEFCNKKSNDLCASCGIIKHKTVKHNPQQNGIVKRMNMTIMDKDMCLKISSGFLNYFAVKRLELLCI